MRKTTTFTRKRAHQDAWAKKRHELINPVTQAVVRANIDADIERLRNSAGLHAYMGDNAQKLANLAGRVCYIVCHAARVKGLEDSPECSIIAGMAGALADIAATPGALEQQRGAIVSGLAAIGRLMPLLDTWHMAQGAFNLDLLIHKTGGMSTGDVQRALTGQGVTA